MSGSLKLTRHAQTRLKQRSIPVAALEALIDFGEPSRCGGADRFALTARSRHELRRGGNAKSRLRELERWLGIYAVLSDDGQIVTVGHRTKRFYAH